MDPHYENLSDKDLVNVVLSDKDAFSVVITRYEDALSRYITRLGVRDRRDVEDILQNSFIKVYRFLRSFDESFSFSSWIYRIVHNETYDFFRVKKRRPEVTIDDDSGQLFISVESGEDMEQVFDNNINKDAVMKALDNLDKKYRDVLLLRYSEDKDYRQISDILQIPEGTVATLIHRGKKSLKALLAKEK